MSDGCSSADERNAAEDPASVLGLAVAAVVAGVWVGMVVAVFRLALRLADGWRDRLVAVSHTLPGPVGLPLVVGSTCACVSAAAWMVRRYSPLATGSGIPQVEAALRQDLTLVPLARLLPCGAQ